MEKVFEIQKHPETGSALLVKFIHTDNFTVIAEISIEGVPGRQRLLRDNDEAWIPLEDNLDRNIMRLKKIGFLPFDLRNVYHEYTVGMFTDE